jgi:hypothetical protein
MQHRGLGERPRHLHGAHHRAASGQAEDDAGPRRRVQERDHIVRARDQADWVVRKGPGHVIEAFVEARGAHRQPPGA